HDYRAGAADVRQLDGEPVAVKIGRARPKVVGCYHLFGADQSTEKAEWMKTEYLVLACTSKRGRHVMKRNVLELVSIIQVHGTKTGSANARCIFQQRLEHWFQLAGRRADDLQYI